MNKKVVILVLDGFGVGYMDDAINCRKQDVDKNTAKHIINLINNIKIPNLCNLGLMNLLNFETDNLKKSTKCIFGKAKLQHHGADTFLGHQELMGSHIRKPLITPFSTFINEVYDELVKNGYKVEKLGNKNKILWVNDCVAIGDNLETDYGQVYNLTTTFKKISFEEELKIANIVRNIVKVSRVICFGGENSTTDSILAAFKEISEYAGIDAPKSKVYEKGYMVRHLGYGIDSENQLPNILNNYKFDVTLIGKVADIVYNKDGKSFKNLVDTETIMKLTIDEIDKLSSGLVCANIQETDLAGHSQDTIKYAKTLEKIDEFIPKILSKLNDNDLFILTADHGNDPTNGTSKHTREYVPLLIYSKKNTVCIDIGIRENMSDTSKTILELFNIDNPLEQGTSYLNKLKINT